MLKKALNTVLERIKRRRFTVISVALCMVLLPVMVVVAQEQVTDTYTLSVPAEVAPGAALAVTWTAPSPRPDTRSWIGVYEPGATDRRPVTWDRIPNNDASGTYTVTLNQPGTYEVRLFRGATYNEVASATVVVTGSTDPGTGTTTPGTGNYVITVFPTSVARGGTVFVEFNGPPSDTNNSGLLQRYNNDWVGIYEQGADDARPYKWERVTAPSGTESFVMSREGVFEVRYFKGRTYNRIFTSEPITVGTPDTTGGVCNGITLANITNYPNNDGPIIAVGNSLTVGVGATPGQDYVSELERRLNVSIVNAGVRGDTTADVLARLESDVLSQNPSTVIVFIGGNDELRRIVEELRNVTGRVGLVDELEDIAVREGYNYDQVELLTRDQSFNNLRTIVERIQASGAEVIVVGLDFGFLSEQISGRYASVAAQTGSVYVPDIYDGVIGRSEYMSDRVHPNDAGYDIFASRIAARLECLVP